jgi:ribosome-associated toxin RatA of RatAB toxin-antitoxin module
MTILDFNIKLSSPPNKLIKLATDYEKFSTYVPAQLKSIKIIESDMDKTITDEVLSFSTLKLNIEQRTIHKKIAENQLLAEIISGPAKKSVIKTTFKKVENGTEVNINIDLHVSLKYKIFIPIIKKWYKMILTGILYKMNSVEEEIK